MKKAEKLVVHEKIKSKFQVDIIFKTHAVNYSTICTFFNTWLKKILSFKCLNLFKCSKNFIVVTNYFGKKLDNIYAEKINQFKF